MDKLEYAKGLLNQIGMPQKTTRCSMRPCFTCDGRVEARVTVVGRYQ